MLREVRNEIPQFLFTSFNIFRQRLRTSRVGSDVFAVVAVPDDLGNGGDCEQRKDSVGFVPTRRAGCDRVNIPVAGRTHDDRVELEHTKRKRENTKLSTLFQSQRRERRHDAHLYIYIDRSPCG